MSDERDYPDMGDLFDDSEDLPKQEVEDTIEESDELPSNLEQMPEFEFLLKSKSREFIYDTLPKIQQGKQCGPRKALYILARSMGYRHTFLQDDESLKELHVTIKDLKLNFTSKGSLSNYLAVEKGHRFSFRHNDQQDWLIIDVPGLTGELKQERFADRLQMRMWKGHHAYFFNPSSKKTVSVSSKKVSMFIDNKLREVLKRNWHGFDVVTMVYQVPLDNTGHFMQSILPHAELGCTYGRAIAATSNEEKKEGRLTLRLKNVNAPKIQIRFVSQNNQTVYIATFNTNCVNFMEKITIIHTFIRELIKENAHLNRQIHKFVQVETIGVCDQFILPFTLHIKPFSFSDYYFSKFRNVGSLFFSFPEQITDLGVVSDRVILAKRDNGKLSSLAYLLEHNKKYMQIWAIRLLRDCIENTRMISTERLRQFLGDTIDPSILALISQLEAVYDQHQKEVTYYAEKEREKQALMIKRLGFIVSAFFAIFTLLQGILAVSAILDLLSAFLSQIP